MRIGITASDGTSYLLAPGGREGPSDFSANPTRQTQIVQKLRAPAVSTFDRKNRQTNISFKVTRIHPTLVEAECFTLGHYDTLPGSGLMTFDVERPNGTVISWAMVASSLQGMQLSFTGMTTISQYNATGGNLVLTAGAGSILPGMVVYPVDPYHTAPVPGGIVKAPLRMLMLAAMSIGGEFPSAPAGTDVELVSGQGVLLVGTLGNVVRLACSDVGSFTALPFTDTVIGLNYLLAIGQGILLVSADGSKINRLSVNSSGSFTALPVTTGTAGDILLGFGQALTLINVAGTKGIRLWTDALGSFQETGELL